MCALYSFHSSVHRPKHTRTCHQRPLPVPPAGFYPSNWTPFLLWIKPRMWPKANETVATWCFLFWGPFLPPIHFREPHLIASSLELGWGFPPLPPCGPPNLPLWAMTATWWPYRGMAGGFPPKGKEGKASIVWFPSEGMGTGKPVIAWEPDVLLLCLILPPRTQCPIHTLSYGQMNSLNSGGHSIKIY